MSFKEAFYTFLDGKPELKSLFESLLETGDVYLIGGVLREYKMTGKIENVRDIDILVNVKSQLYFAAVLNKYCESKNSCGGFRLLCDDVKLDVWDIKNTWAYKKGFVKIENKSDYINKISKTVFLNIDSLFFDWKNDVWDDKGYELAVTNNVLDVVLSENPNPKLNVLHSFVYKKIYGFNFSSRLSNYIYDTIKNNGLEYIDALIEKEQEHYGYEVVSKEDILDWFENF